MSRTATRGLTAPAARLALESFGKRLQNQLDNKGMSYSDLARRVWGTTTTTKGNPVARNRDRIAVYAKGQQWPNSANLKKIADALGMTIQDLAPEIVGEIIEGEKNPEISMVQIPSADHPDMCFLRINKLVPLTLAATIIKMLVATHPDDDHTGTSPPKITHLTHALAD
jgi:transcriptional regulator with XRE-family HTH domain